MRNVETIVLQTEYFSNRNFMNVPLLKTEREQLVFWIKPKYVTLKFSSKIQLMIVLHSSTAGTQKNGSHWF